MHYARLGRRLANSFLVALSAREEKHDVDWHLARRHGSTILALRVGTGWRQQSDSVQVAASSGDQILLLSLANGFISYSGQQLAFPVKALASGNFPGSRIFSGAKNSSIML
jgi:hypothetical protein